MIRVFHATPWYNYSNWIPNRVSVGTIEEADIVMFLGGTDVGSSLYNEPRGKWTDLPDINRDEKEKEMFDKAMLLGKKIIGVCRGSQFCCVMSGGRLVQHQKNPAYLHKMQTENGELDINSTHHQAQYPYDLPKEDYVLLGWTNNILPFHYDGEGKETLREGEKEVEVCFYKKTNALAIQFHPELLYGLNKYEKTFEFLYKCIEDYLNIKLN